MYQTIIISAKDTSEKKIKLCQRVKLGIITKYIKIFNLIVNLYTHIYIYIYTHACKCIHTYSYIKSVSITNKYVGESMVEVW